VSCANLFHDVQAHHQGCRQIGRELGADYVLESSVRRDRGADADYGPTDRVENQRHIWANSYDRDVTHSIAVQEEVAREVALQIQLSSRGAGWSSFRSAPLNPAANEAYLKGRYFSINSLKTDSAKRLHTSNRP